MECECCGERQGLTWVYENGLWVTYCYSCLEPTDAGWVRLAEYEDMVGQVDELKAALDQLKADYIHLEEERDALDKEIDRGSDLWREVNWLRQSLKGALRRLNEHYPLEDDDE